MRVILIWLDDDGFESYREEFDVENVPGKFREVVDVLVSRGGGVGQVGDVIVEVL